MDRLTHAANQLLVNIIVRHSLRTYGAADGVGDVSPGKQVSRVAGIELRLSDLQKIGRQNYVAVKLLCLNAVIQLFCDFLDGSIVDRHLLDRIIAWQHPARLCGLLFGVGVQCRRLLIVLRLLFVPQSLAGIDLQRYARVHLARLIDDCQPRRATRAKAKHQRRHHGECGHHQGTQNRRDDEKLRAHALDIFALDDREEFFHAASLTFSMKMSCKLGSTNSNLLTGTPASTSRFSNTCGSAPGASNASNSSPTGRILATNSGSFNTPSLPSNLSATALRAKLCRISRSRPSNTLRDR